MAPTARSLLRRARSRSSCGSGPRAHALRRGDVRRKGRRLTAPHCFRRRRPWGLPRRRLIRKSPARIWRCRHAPVGRAAAIFAAVFAFDESSFVFCGTAVLPAEDPERRRDAEGRDQASEGRPRARDQSEDGNGSLRRLEQNRTLCVSKFGRRTHRDHPLEPARPLAQPHRLDDAASAQHFSVRTSKISRRHV